MSNAEINLFSHFMWSNAASISSYVISRRGIKTNGRTGMFIAGSITTTAGIAKEIHDYISTYPSFNLRDTASDLISNVFGISAGLAIVYFARNSHWIINRAKYVGELIRKYSMSL